MAFGYCNEIKEGTLLIITCIMLISILKDLSFFCVMDHLHDTPCLTYWTFFGSFKLTMCNCTSCALVHELSQRGYIVFMISYIYISEISCRIPLLQSHNLLMEVIRSKRLVLFESKVSINCNSGCFTKSSFWIISFFSPINRGNSFTERSVLNNSEFLTESSF